jgi:hypothetical protein
MTYKMADAQAPPVAPVVPVPPVPQAFPPLPPQLSLTPARVSNAVIDYGTSDGRKQFKAATAPLQESYNLESSELQLMLQLLRDRTFEQDWTDIALIPVGGVS